MVPEVGLLYGREDECRRLMAGWSQAAAGHPRIACVVAGPGAGKSAMLRWLEIQCTAADPAVRAVWLSPPAVTETGLAMAARSLAGVLGLRAGPLEDLEASVHELTGISEPDVLRYQASLILHLSGQYRPQTRDPARFQAGALALARRLVVSYAARHPVLLLLDEPNRTDRLARQWLADLLADARLHPCHLMVVCATTPARVSDLEPLTREVVAEHIHLDPLPESPARALLESRARGSAGPSEIESALQAAQGNPACLVAFGSALARGSPLPSSWEAAIRTEIENLTAPERALVDALAVVGGPVALPLLARIASTETPADAAALPVPLLAETDTGVWFRQSGAAEVCLDLLPPAAMSRLRRRAGAVFEEAFPLVAARHFERAGDRDSLLRTLDAAAKAARSRFALEEARELLQRAHDATPGDSSPSPELALGLASVDITLGAYREALEVLSRRAARMEGIDRARAFRLMGRALERKGEYQAAKAHILEGIAVPGDMSATERSGLLADIAVIHLRQGQMEDARRSAEQALGLLGADTAAPEYALAHSVIGITYYRQGRFPQALSHHQTALERREAAGDVQGMANSLNNLGSVHLEAGNWHEALASFGRALALAEAAGDAHTRTALLNNLASLHLARGELAEAETACRESLEAKSRAGETPGIGIALATLAAILGRQGRPAEAVAAAEEAIALLEQLGEREVLSDVYACRGELLLQTGDREEAWAALSRAQVLAGEAGKVAVVARVYRLLSELYRHEGRADDSLAFAQEAVELNRFLPRKLELARSLMQLGLAGGDSDGKAEREARELFGALGVTPSTGAAVS